jgi:hypothetical protein
MDADRLVDERYVLDEEAFVELAVWRLPRPLLGSAHWFKYRLALVVKGECALRYDNESGRGDHRHMGKRERPYPDPDTLIEDFWRDAEELRRWRW